MPYSVDNPPDAVKGLPAHAIEIFVAAYNSAFEQYDGDEAKSAATAWAAVKTKFKKEGDNWVAKESLSDDDKRGVLQRAVDVQYGLTPDHNIPKYAYVEEVYDDYLVYSVNDQSYKAPYTVGEDGEVVLGEPEKVVRQTVYTPMESLQAVYSEIIQEAGKRNARLDAARVKKIVELCQELLDSEPDEKEIKKVTKEARSTLKWLKELEIMKTEEGIQYPKEAYAYTPDDNWQLRLWEGESVTRAMLNKAAASLSPGGYKGQKVVIPTVNLAEVKRRIRGEYRALGVIEDEIPKWVKETETRERILDYVPLTEAKFDKGRATVVVIKPGFNATEDRYYPAEMLKRDYKIFEGMKMYADHPTEAEDKARPERSIKDWVATLSEVTVDDKGVVTGIAEVVEPWLMQKLASLRDKQMLSEMGISINAVGSASKGTIDGKETLVIEKLEYARSVDFVTEPGAGGVVTLYESDRSQDIDLMDLSNLKDKRPDLIKLVIAEVRAEIQQEVKHMLEQEDRITELEGQVGTLTTERDGLKEAAERAEKDKAIAEAQATIKEAVDKAELPDAAKEVLLKRFESAESAEGIAEAIKSEVDYIAKLAESGKVKNLGPSHVNTEKGKEALRESFKRSNPDWTDAQLDVAVTGR